MKSNILKSLTALLVLMVALTANTFSQSASVKSSSSKLTKKVLIVLSAADTWTRLLASTLRKYGANYTCGAKNWGDYVMVDGNLITGQNPASSIPMAKAIIEVLNKSNSFNLFQVINVNN